MNILELKGSIAELIGPINDRELLIQICEAAIKIIRPDIAENHLWWQGLTIKQKAFWMELLERK